MNFYADRVSVLIPLYNRKCYIEETIESVLAQDYPDIELIVIDDGSTDGSYEIAEQYEREGKLRLLKHADRSNKGQSAALNVGLRGASGEFVAILDSDDLFASGKLAKQVEYLKLHSEIGLVYGNGKAIDSKGREIYEMNQKPKNEVNDPNAILLDCYFLLPQNSLVRRSVYETVGLFDESLRSGQDHDMLIRICEITRVAYQPINSFLYRRHGDSISANNLETRWRCGLVILEKASSRYAYKKSTLRKRRAVVNFRLAQALLGKKKTSLEGLSRLIYSGMLDPKRAILTLINPGLMTK